MTLRVAMLANYPVPEDLSPMLAAEQRYPPTAVVDLVDALSDLPDLELHVIRLAKGVREPSRFALGRSTQLHVLPTRRGTGMPVGYVPRIPQIRRYLRAIDPDLVHGQGTEDGYGWLAVHSGLRHIVTVHGLLASINREDELPIFHPRRVGAWTERSTLRQADAVIAIAGFVKEQLRRYDVSFYEIPNAVSSNFYELTHQPPDTPTLLCVGRLTPAKGILDLIRALKLLDDRKIRCDVKVIGASGGETIAYETECKKAAEQLTHVRVTFSGHVQRTALANEYRHATALVMTSHAETLPMVIAEAMATGLPAVAYDVGGIGDQIDDDINGYLIPRGDVERLASRLENIIVDEGLADRFGSAARDKAKGWHEGRVADETVRAYADIVGRSATGNR